MNRSSVAIALSGFLAACALLCAFAGFFQPLFWPAAAASGATSYLLWNYGRRRILAVGYGTAGLDEDGHTAGEHRRVTTEDWHRGGFEYRTGDPSPSDDDWDDWRWPGAFWRDDVAEDGRTATDGDPTDGTEARGRRDRWRDDEAYGWWGGWDEETASDGGATDYGGGETDDRRGQPGATGSQRSRGRSTGGATAGRSRDERGRSSESRQRHLTRAEEEAAAILGVAPDASPEEVRAAYRDRVLETHPDHGGDEAAFRRVCWAYDQLCE